MCKSDKIVELRPIVSAYPLYIQGVAALLDMKEETSLKGKYFTDRN